MIQNYRSCINFKAGCIFFPALLFIIFILFVYKYQNEIAINIAKSFVVEDSFEKADAIIVLGGSIPDRLLEAITLHKEKRSDLILITKTLDPVAYNHLEELNAEYRLNHEIKLGILSKLDVSKKNIVVLDGKMPNTYYEALNAYGYLEKHNLSSLIVVTSKLHTKRASVIFDDITKGKFEIYVKPSRYDPFDAENPESVKIYSKTMLYEFQKLLFYRVTSFLSADYPALH